MKCVFGFLLIAFGAFQMISAWPVRNNNGGMLLYQPDYYRHRAFVMHYASQPVKSYRRHGEAATSSFASGNRFRTDSQLKNEDESSEEEYSSQENRSPGQSTSIAVASHDEQPESEAPESYDNSENNVQPSRDEVPDEDEEEQRPPSRSKVSAKKASSGTVTYFPINFGGNPGVVAIANSYSTGKGGSASSRATAYGSPSSKSKKKLL